MPCLFSRRHHFSLLQTFRLEGLLTLQCYSVEHFILNAANKPLLTEKNQGDCIALDHFKKKTKIVSQAKSFPISNFSFTRELKIYHSQGLSNTLKVGGFLRCDLPYFLQLITWIALDFVCLLVGDPSALACKGQSPFSRRWNDFCIFKRWSFLQQHSGFSWRSLVSHLHAVFLENTASVSTYVYKMGKYLLKKI